MAALLLSLPFTAGGWAWIYSFASTIRQGASKVPNAMVLKTNLSLNWNGPFDILAVGPAPASHTPDNRSLQCKFLSIDLPTDLTLRGSNHRVAVEERKPCRNPEDIHGIPKYLPSGLTTRVPPPPPSPPLTTRPLRTSQHRRSSSRWNKPQATNSSAAAAG